MLDLIEQLSALIWHILYSCVIAGCSGEYMRRIGNDVLYFVCNFLYGVVRYKYCKAISVISFLYYNHFLYLTRILSVWLEGHL